MTTSSTMLNLVLRTRSASQTDSELLANYVHQQDAVAFRVIVERHGNMVLSVCQRGVRNAADAEDLFQKVFLELARAAPGIRQPEALAAWLHGTARRLTLQWQKSQYRSLPDQPVRSVSDPLADASWKEVRQLLDAEVAQLPNRLRSPLVLCYLQGLTGSEAANRLGISLRTLRRDLEAGRVLLRKRLAQRGLTRLTLVAALAVSADLQAIPPVELVQTTVAKWAAWKTGALKIATVKTLLTSAFSSWTSSIMSIVLLTGISALLLAWTNPANVPHVLTSSISPLTITQAISRIDAYGEPLPDGILARLGSNRFRHGSPVYAMEFSNDDQRLYTGSNDGTLRCSAFPSGKILWSVTMPNVAVNGFEAVVAIAISADDNLLAVSAMNDTTVLYDARTGKELKRLGDKRDRSSWLGFSSDGKSLFAMTTTQATSVREYDLATGETISKQDIQDCFDEAANMRNIHFAIGRMQDRVVLADLKHQLVVFNLKTHQVERRVAQHPKAVVSVVWSEDGSAWLSLDAENMLRRWDAKTGELQWKQPVAAVQGNGMLALAGKGDAARAILATNRDIQVFHPKTGLLEQKIAKRSMNYWLTFSHNSKVMVAAGPYGDLAFLDFTTLKPFAAVPTSPISNGLSSCDYSPDSKQLVTGGVYDDTMVWDIASGKLLDQLKVKGKARFVNQQQIVTAGWNVGGLAVWNLKPAQQHRAFKDAVLKHAKGIRDLVLMPDGKQVLVVASVGTKVSIWDIVSGKLVRGFDEIKTDVIRAVCSPDGRWLAVNDFSDQLIICDIATGAKLHQQLIPGGQGGSLAFSPNSKLLAWSAGDTKIHIMNTANWTDQVIIDYRGGPLDALAFSTDGRSLLWGGQHWPTIFVFDPLTGQERTQLRHHLGPIEYLCFAPDGHSFASTSKDATVLIWDWHQYHARRGQASQPLKADVRDVLFQELLGPDAKKSWQALQQLLRSPTQCLEWIDQHLIPVPKPELAQMQQWISTLDSTKFETREQADKQLRHHLEHAEPLLQQAMSGKPSAELKIRLEKLLNEWQQRHLLKDRLQELLESLHTPEARHLSQKLATYGLKLQ